MGEILKFIGYAILVILYVSLMVASIAIGLFAGAFVSIFLSFKHYFSALHEELGG